MRFDRKKQALWRLLQRLCTQSAQTLVETIRHDTNSAPNRNIPHTASLRLTGICSFHIYMAISLDMKGYMWAAYARNRHWQDHDYCMSAMPISLSHCLDTVRNGVRECLAQVHHVLINALIGRATKPGPILWERYALEHVGEKKGDGPHNNYGDHAPRDHCEMRTGEDTEGSHKRISMEYSTHDPPLI